VFDEGGSMKIGKKRGRKKGQQESLNAPSIGRGQNRTGFKENFGNNSVPNPEEYKIGEQRFCKEK